VCRGPGEETKVGEKPESQEAGTQNKRQAGSRRGRYPGERKREETCRKREKVVRVRICREIYRTQKFQDPAPRQRENLGTSSRHPGRKRAETSLQKRKRSGRDLLRNAGCRDPEPRVFLPPVQAPIECRKETQDSRHLVKKVCRTVAERAFLREIQSSETKR